VRYIGATGDDGKRFGVTGSYGPTGDIEGVGISVDGGKTFTTYDAALDTRARYGAFPGDTVWYVAGGDWPDAAGSCVRTRAGWLGAWRDGWCWCWWW
jgi:hypothetical protein